MNYLRLAICATALLAFTAVSSLHADVKTEEKMTFELGGMLGKVVNLFGGKSDNLTAIALKGPRLSTMSDQSGQIIDLSEEKVYSVDVKRKTYRVLTFAQIRQQMEEARAKAEKAAREEQAKNKEPGPTPEEQKKAAESIDFDLDVKKTGQSRTINGFNTNQVMVVVTVREKGKTLEQSGGLQIDDRHVDGAADGGDEGNRRLPHAGRAEAVRPDDRGCVPPGHGRGDGDLSDAEARTRADESGARQADGHRHPDHRESRGGEVRRAVRGGTETAR